MDVDWCLSCERKLDDFPAASGPYCSPECLSYAQPSSSPISPLPANSNACRIRQWAQAIPQRVPAGAPAHPFSGSATNSFTFDLSSHFELLPPSPRKCHQPTPKLIERTAVSTPLPTLCVSSPAHIRPLPPARASSRTYSPPNTAANTMASMSDASTSLTSLLSEPMVATPDEDCSFSANIGTLVRSLVHRDRTSCTQGPREDYVTEKFTDYFPRLPLAKKTFSSSKKPKTIQPLSPVPVLRRKSPTKKIVAPQERDRSSPTHSHTPTPVVFPSCRAAVVDVEDDDGRAVAPQAQYHSAYYQKYAPQRQYAQEQLRSPSLATSVSSTGSSVLLMAPKRWDDIRGRKGGRAIAA
ncbi:hypothetical protein PAXRUDRAFT_821359 [Paxillus rubicundulus Ve08.2h10]|uniref:Uncharacterized protein n=1 Tax=Paxillus rubicundulus Ve08.2h10 TaxID=930991 RepID=A0A0D0DP32_9AGAM|nr:hypothetical protein PAXRUDRAFT_821359 [Paxillus rubicundulus Ve08.2h10]